jgi:hypothetical protein
MSNDDDQELLNMYRSASTQDAGAPPAAVRKAVLAEAAAAPRRRQPAANDTKYIWRAVAGIGVMAVALLIWRESAPELSRTRARESRTVETPRDTTHVAPAAQTSAPSVATEQQTQPSQRRQEKAEANSVPMPTSPPLSRPVQVAQARAPSPTPPPRDTERLDAVVQDAGAAAVAEQTPTLAAAPAAEAKQTQTDVAASVGRVARRPTPAQLYQFNFPDSNDASIDTSTAWLLLNNASEVIEKGRLLPTDNLEALRMRLIDRHGVAIGAWQSTAGYDQQGRSFQIAIARIY